MIAEVVKIEVPPLEVPAIELLIATPTAKGKKTEKDSETKTTNFKPSSQRRSGRKKKKEPLPKLESEQEVESTEETGRSKADKEDEPATPLPDTLLENLWPKQRKFNTKLLIIVVVSDALFWTEFNKKALFRTVVLANQ